MIRGNVPFEPSAPAPSGPSAAPGDAPGLVEHYFRHEYGRQVALLARKAGVRHLALVEEAVQGAMMAALTAWVARGLPDDPSAWLYRAAWRNLLGELRRGVRRRRILEQTAAEIVREGEDPPAPSFAADVSDDLLRMLFVCCDEAIPGESRLVLALKTLCGFNAAEIALRLFTTEANVWKRLTRARHKLRASPLALETPPLETLRTRLASVHTVLYLLFNEGYLAAHAELAIRRDLCDEAIRLTTILATHAVGAAPETFALLALMHLQAARLPARQDETGALLLLEEQDRSRWDANHLRDGAEWLARSAQGDTFSRYHAEAGIAAEHAFASSFVETRWDRIDELYAMLERIDPSPQHTLNRAVAVAERHGAQAGLALLRELRPPAWLAESYQWHAVLADLHRRAGDVMLAREHRERALACAPTTFVRDLLRRRLASIDTPEAR